MTSTSQRSCACGRHYDNERWAALPVFARLAAKDVSSIATPWPTHLVVEVRVCTTCRRHISRLRDDAKQLRVKEQDAIAA
jgi:hypothetical protein